MDQQRMSLNEQQSIGNTKTHIPISRLLKVIAEEACLIACVTRYANFLTCLQVLTKESA